MRDLRLTRVDADQGGARPGGDPFRGHAYRRHGRAGAELDDDKLRTGRFAEPGRKPPFLVGGSSGDPMPIAEHQDIRPRNRAAAWTLRQPRDRTEALLIDLDVEIVRSPDLAAAGLGALEMADRSVAFDHPFAIEPGELEVAIDIRGENETAIFEPIRPPAENFETRVRRGRPVEPESMPIESPGELGIAGEPARVGHVDEGHTEPFERRVCLPESLVASKIRQPRVDAHPGAGGDQQGVRICDRVSGHRNLCARVLIHGWIVARSRARRIVAHWHRGFTNWMVPICWNWWLTGEFVGIS